MFSWLLAHRMAKVGQACFVIKTRGTEAGEVDRKVERWCSRLPWDFLDIFH